MYTPEKELNNLYSQKVAVIINEARFSGVLIGWDENDYVIQSDGTTFIVNRRAADMIYADSEA